MFRHHQVDQGHPVEEDGFAVAEQIDQVRIDVFEQAILQQENANLRRIHRRLEVGFLLVQHRHGTDLLADIERHTVNLPRLALCIGVENQGVMAMAESAKAVIKPVMDHQRSTLTGVLI